jgi:SmpA / OmlA family
MTRRKKSAVALIAVALALGAGAGVVVALREPSLEQKLEQVRVGMSRDEVVEIMGEPGAAAGSFFYWDRYWSDKRGHVLIRFNAEDRVFDKAFTRREPSNFLDRVLAWLGL